MNSRVSAKKIFAEHLADSEVYINGQTQKHWKSCVKYDQSINDGLTAGIEFVSQSVEIGTGRAWLLSSTKSTAVTSRIVSRCTDHSVTSGLIETDLPTAG